MPARDIRTLKISDFVMTPTMSPCGPVTGTPVIAAPTTVTIVGEVNDQYQILFKDGTIYEIADTEKGDEVLQFIGSVVEVTGLVEEEDGVKVLDVKSFKAKDE
jgi:hypothetical protein